MTNSALEGLLPYANILFQLVVAVGLGAALGIERYKAGKNAGMRTYALVSMGSCLFITTAGIVTTAYVGVTAFDPLRVMAAIVMGIGFLTGGLIFVSNKDSQVHGITTSAGIWVATGIGIAVGFSLYSLAIMATVLTLFILHGMLGIEKRFLGREE